MSELNGLLRLYFIGDNNNSECAILPINELKQIFND